MAHAKLTFHLSNGHTVSAISEEMENETGATAETLADEFASFLRDLDRPQFISVNHLVVHTQTISAIECEII